jgi:hypothetical protein
MTTITRTDGSVQSAHEIDIRCSAVLPHATPDEGRCQLFAGHDGPHAVMFAHCMQRVIHVWDGHGSAAVADAGPDALQRPWMIGYPMPAWFETDSARPSD